MAAGKQSESDANVEAGSQDTPELSVCETEPGKTVFIESDNTDGWLASNLTVDVTR
jgi:hypothetical protein